MSIIAQASQAIRYCRENDFGTVLRYVKSKDAHPWVQFAKYGLCGVMATVVTNGVAVWLMHTWFPAIDGMVIEGEVITKETRAWNSMWANLSGWVPGNLVAYFTNLALVFQGGRHSRSKEFLYFSIVSLIATLAGLLAGPYMINQFGIHTYFAQSSLLVTAVMVNYVARKFFIFKG